MKVKELVNSDHSHRAWMFLCPACNAPHQCDDRWVYNSNSERPTFTGSVMVQSIPDIGRPQCHSQVTDGKIAYYEDSGHSLRGQTVELPDWVP